MNELDLITEIVEEKIAKGNFRWLANFQEIRRDFQIEDLKFPLYASGGLEEKGFALSRLFSSWVTPKYKVHFLFMTSNEIDDKFLRKLIAASKKKFGGDDWIFLGLAQNKPIEKTVKNILENLAERNVGIVVYSLSSKEEISSGNVLGKGLKKQLKLTDAKFEAFDLPDYVKSFTIVFSLSALLLIIAQLSYSTQTFNTTTTAIALMFIFVFSLLAGHALYKSQYHVTMQFTSKGFELKKGKKLASGKWADFKDATIYITPKHETCLRLYGENEKTDLPISRTGLSRREAYNIVKRVIEKKQPTIQS